MKRLNRKKILEALETARQGFNSICLRFIGSDQLQDKVVLMSMTAHHHQLNCVIVELGGESVVLNESIIRPKLDGKPIAQQFQDDLNSLIDNYRDQGITLSETVGAIELVKLDLWKESIEE